MADIVVIIRVTIIIMITAAVVGGCGGGGGCGCVGCCGECGLPSPLYRQAIMLITVSGCCSTAAAAVNARL